LKKHVLNVHRLRRLPSAEWLNYLKNKFDSYSIVV
jgi:hypothetical protein